MTLEEFTAELDAKLASMSDQELLQALIDAGFEPEEPPTGDLATSGDLG